MRLPLREIKWKLHGSTRPSPPAHGALPPSAPLGPGSESQRAGRGQRGPCQALSAAGQSRAGRQLPRAGRARPGRGGRSRGAGRTARGGAHGPGPRPHLHLDSGSEPDGASGEGGAGSLTDLHALEQRAFAVARAGDIGLPGGGGGGGGAVDPHQAVHGRRGGAARGAGGSGAAGGGSGRRPALGPRMQEARGGEGAPRLAGLRALPSYRGAVGLSAWGRAPLRTPRLPLRSPGGVRSARGWRPGNGLAAGARAAGGAEPLLLASPSRAPPPPPPPPPHSSPRRSGFAPRPRSEAGRRSDVSARRGCRFPPRGGRGGGARCANPRRGSPAPPPRAAGRGDGEGGGLLKGQSKAVRVDPGPARRKKGAASPHKRRSVWKLCPAQARPGRAGLGPSLCGCVPPNPGLGVLDRGFGGKLVPLQRSTRSLGLEAGEIRERRGALQVVRYLISLSTPRFQICSSKRPQPTAPPRAIYLDLEEVDWGKLELL